MQNNIYPEIGVIIKEIRGYIQQKDFASFMEMQQSRLSRWEKGEIPESFFVLKRIADHAGMMIDEILEGRRVTRIHQDRRKQLMACQEFTKMVVAGAEKETNSMLTTCAFDDHWVWRLVA